jgi:succinate dehydrogenase/fumarate reductase cytochrome b subunit
LLALSGEISRKTRAPAEEIEGVASYTKILGTYGAVHAVWLVRIIATALVAVLGYHLQVSIWFYVVLAMLFIAALIASLPFYWQASQSAARRMESYAGIYIVVFNITLAVELACTYGVRFTGLK